MHRLTDGPAQGAEELEIATATPHDRLATAAKRVFDVLASAGGLLFLLPLLLLVAVLIRLDSPGPAIFRQRRAGLNGRPFVIYKFRTMTAADDGPAIEHARPDDPRVTWLGRRLRAASIDELPQLINVLKGDMSLVGPRPHAVAHAEEFSRLYPGYALRHRMKPGLTGWAQVRGFRGEAALGDASRREQVALDLWYARHWSLALDMRILLLTVREAFKPSETVREALWSETSESLGFSSEPRSARAASQ